MVLNKKYIKLCVLSMVMLVMMFNLGIFMESHAKRGLGLSNLHARHQPQKITQSAEFSKTMDGLRVPPLNRVNSGVVYDCVTWEHISTYDPEMVKRNYHTFPSVPEYEENDDHREQSFIDIYNKQTWGVRGPGVKLERSKGVTALLHIMIERLKIQLNKSRIKILDLPCGDLQYMSHFLETRNDIDYTGVDIVPFLIDKHTERYKGNRNIHFETTDIVKDELTESYDIILCRMMLQHLVFKDVLQVLFHFSKSNSTYLAATTFSENMVNNEVVLSGGRYRPLNLEKPPINLSPPICNYKEPIEPVLYNHYMAIWKLPLLQQI